MAEKLLYIITMIFTLSMFLILSEWRYSRRVTLSIAAGLLAVCGGAFFFALDRLYYAVGAGVPIGFFLLYMLSNLGGKPESLSYVTLYSLLPADRMIAGEGSVWPFMAALGGLALLLFGMGAVRFTRRDLSL